MFIFQRVYDAGLNYVITDDVKANKPSTLNFFPIVQDFSSILYVYTCLLWKRQLVCANSHCLPVYDTGLGRQSYPFTFLVFVHAFYTVYTSFRMSKVFSVLKALLGCFHTLIKMR